MEPSTNSNEFDAGTLGERFQVKGRLGHGGSGDVYEAFDQVLERTVAVKVLRPGNPDPQAGDRLLREARACARLSHGSIVTVHEVVQVDDEIGIVMERLPGTSLDGAEGGTWERTLGGRIGIVVQILFGLGYAHRHGVVHRDVKPRNVQLLPDGSIKMLDFGVAHITGVDTLTVTGTITGTVHYASPEQLRGEKTDSRTDIYSTGVLAYELLTGRRPFDGDTIGAVVTQVLHEELPKMSGSWTGAVPEIEEIVRKATAKKREDRYAKAEEMRDALRAVLESMSIEARGTDLGPLPGKGEARSVPTSSSRGARSQETETTAATPSVTGTHESEPAQTGSTTSRWRQRWGIAATIAAAAVAGLLLTSSGREPETAETQPPPASPGVDVFLPASNTDAGPGGGATPAGDEEDETRATEVARTRRRPTPTDRCARPSRRSRRAQAQKRRGSRAVRPKGSTTRARTRRKEIR